MMWQKEAIASVHALNCKAMEVCKTISNGLRDAPMFSDLHESLYLAEDCSAGVANAALPARPHRHCQLAGT